METGGQESAFSQQNVLEIDKVQLKPGQVLFEEIPNIPGMKSGYVLSISDIEKIQRSPKITSVKILLIEKASDLPPTAPHRSRTELKDEIQKLDLPDLEKRNSLYDRGLGERVEQLVGLKKEFIRGEKYHERVDTHREDNIKKFHSTLKTIHTQQKEETMQAIAVFAKSAADIDGLSEIDGLDLQALVNKLDRYERNIKYFMDAVERENMIITAFIEEIVLDFINDVGFQLARGLFSAISKNEHYSNFIISHTLQVMIVALITAIEMSKMITEKTAEMKHNDLNTFLAIGKKSYQLEDLINLGIAAVLHDIDIKIRVPDLTYSYNGGYEWDSIIDTHPTNGFHLVKRLGLSFDVERAVFQHHERIDGSGFPNGTLPRFFSKYTPVIMFAEHYIESTTPNPFVDKYYSPRTALVEILSRQRHQLDGDSIYAFIRAASLFPIGTWLLLSDGNIGIVYDINKELLERPILKVFFDRSLQRVNPFMEDLSKSNVQIVKPIDLSSIRKIAGGPLNFIFSNT
ncbi:MAG: HD domain-containing protein [Brevinematales bacterium]|nr:HD domain-containing protein [Brevinematales bacterium]